MDIYNRYIKYVILLLLIILLGEIAFYLFFASKSIGNKSLALFSPNEELLKASIADESGKIEKHKKDIEDTLKKAKINFNYFNKDRTIENISPFLEDLKKHSEETNVPILSIEPQPVEQHDNYLKRSFYISLRGDYKNIVRFVSALEYKGGFSTSKFEITTGTGSNVEEKRFKFLLSAFKIADSKIPVLEDWLGVSGNINIPANDPFKSIMEEIADSIKQKEQIEAANKSVDMQKKGIAEEKGADLSTIILEAVADINGNKAAIINHNILKEGDIYEGFVIKRIGSDTAIITKDGKEYTLRLYNLSPLVHDHKAIDIKLGQKKKYPQDEYTDKDDSFGRYAGSNKNIQPSVDAFMESKVKKAFDIEQVKALKNTTAEQTDLDLSARSYKAAAEVTTVIVSKEDKKSIPSLTNKRDIDIPHPLSIPNIIKPAEKKAIEDKKPLTDKPAETALKTVTPQTSIINKVDKPVQTSVKTDKTELDIPHPLNLPSSAKPAEKKKTDNRKPVLKKKTETVLDKITAVQVNSNNKNTFSVVIASCVFEECAGEMEKRLLSNGVSSFKRHKLHGLINTYSVVLDMPVEKREADRILSDIKGVAVFNFINSDTDRFYLKSTSTIYKKTADEILNKVREKGYAAGITMDREKMAVNKLIISGFDSYLTADNMSSELKTAGFEPIVYKDSELFK